MVIRNVLNTIGAQSRQMASNETVIAAHGEALECLDKSLLVIKPRKAVASGKFP